MLHSIILDEKINMHDKEVRIWKVMFVTYYNTVYSICLARLRKSQKTSANIANILPTI
jgi:hypothetical protein